MTQRYLATVKRLFGYALAIVLVPFLAGAVGMGIRLGTSSSTDTNPPPGKWTYWTGSDDFCTSVFSASGTTSSAGTIRFRSWVEAV